MHLSCQSPRFETQTEIKIISSQQNPILLLPSFSCYFHSFVNDKLKILFWPLQDLMHRERTQTERKWILFRHQKWHFVRDKTVSQFSCSPTKEYKHSFHLRNGDPKQSKWRVLALTATDRWSSIGCCWWWRLCSSCGHRTLTPTIIRPPTWVRTYPFGFRKMSHSRHLFPLFSSFQIQLMVSKNWQIVGFIQKTAFGK